jgi:hypothetical protein
VSRIWYAGKTDGSAQALKFDPDLFLSAVQNTSLLCKLTPVAVDDVLAAVHRDRDSGKLADLMAEYEPLTAEFGDGSMFVARP